MGARRQLPGSRWFWWLRNAPLRIGILTGIYLSCVFLSWLLVANRLPQLEPFASIRNLAAGVVTVILLLIPVLRFRHEPLRMFVSGLTAWTILTFTYLVAEMRFSLLESRMGALHMYILGAVTYGFVAVFHWVFLMCAEARHRHIEQIEQAAASVARPRPH
jgi:hypothetical protein